MTKINKYRFFSLLMLLNLNWFVALMVLQSNDKHELNQTNTSIKINDLIKDFEKISDTQNILSRIKVLTKSEVINIELINNENSIVVIDKKITNKYFTFIKSLNLIV